MNDASEVILPCYVSRSRGNSKVQASTSTNSTNSNNLFGPGSPDSTAGFETARDRPHTPDFQRRQSSVSESSDSTTQSDNDAIMRLSTNMPISRDIKILPGKHLVFKSFVPIEEMDKEMPRTHSHDDQTLTDEQLTPNSNNDNSNLSQIFDIFEIPIPNSSNIKTDLNVDTFGNVKHLCNGSRSHLFRGKLDEKPVILKILIESAVTNEQAQNEYILELGTYCSHMCIPFVFLCTDAYCVYTYAYFLSPFFIYLTI